MKTDTPLDEFKNLLLQLNSTPHGRRAFLMSVPLLLSACASSSKHRYREGDNQGQETTLSVNDEIKMTKEYLPKMTKEYPAIKDKEVQKYIKRLGNKIVKANVLSSKPYRYNFTVVESKHINAFALPAGTVFVTSPLIAMADTEAELAGVIGHEIGHIKARHTAERIDYARRAKKKSWLYGVIGGVAGGVTDYGLGKLLCKKNDKKCIKKAALKGVVAGAGGGLLVQKFAFMANSREDEMEADRVGFRTSLTAGFHKDYIGNFYIKLLEMEKKMKQGQSSFHKAFADAMSTHPPSQERVEQADALANSAINRKGSIITTKKFSKIKKILKG
ncbi:MAG: M48 family metalloprotease [Halobacteriovoraceae bacterium]|nr:M48 family metalloprotease [Halobacteriovoraceae bacterium]